MRSRTRWLSSMLMVSIACHQSAHLASSFTFTAKGSRKVGTSTFCNRQVVPRYQSDSSSRNTRQSSSSLQMFLGQDAGVLGVGAPEVITIVLVGYFVLGPSELYKLTKEIGKFITNIRAVGQEATSSFEGAMENQLALGEIRKAQAELSDAFSFRRSINVEEADPAFTTSAPPSAVATLEKDEVTGTVGNPNTPIKKKKRKKRVVVTEETALEDLDVSEEDFKSVMQATTASAPGYDVEDDEIRQKEADLDRFLDYQDDVWERRMRELDEKDMELNTPKQDEMSRFQAQLSNNWNDQILAKETELEPLGKVMEQLALLEREREAAISRIEEEFRRKEATEQEFYFRKRKLLEDAAAEIQAKAYSIPSDNKISGMMQTSESNIAPTLIESKKMDDVLDMSQSKEVKPLTSKVETPKDEEGNKITDRDIADANSLKVETKLEANTPKKEEDAQKPQEVTQKN